MALIQPRELLEPKCSFLVQLLGREGAKAFITKNPQLLRISSDLARSNLRCGGGHGAVCVLGGGGGGTAGGVRACARARQWECWVVLGGDKGRVLTG